MWLSYVVHVDADKNEADEDCYEFKDQLGKTSETEPTVSNKSS
jgi:hypothetical protein